MPGHEIKCKSLRGVRFLWTCEIRSHHNPRQRESLFPEELYRVARAGAEVLGHLLAVPVFMNKGPKTQNEATVEWKLVN